MGQVEARAQRGGGGSRPLFALVLFSALACVMTFPLALRAGSALIGTDSNALNDSYLSIWIFGWQARQLVVNPLHLFQGNIFYPFANTLAFTEIILPEALLYLPLAFATGNPVLAYNLVVLGLFALNGLGMYLWVIDRFRTDARPEIRQAAALVAGLIFAFCAYKLGEIRHVQLLAAQWMPLTLLYLGRGLERPTARNGLLTALFFALNALSSLYYAVFLAVAVVLYALADFAVRRYRPSRAHLAYGLTAALVLLILVGPFLVPYLQLERQYHFSQGRDPRLFAARPASYLASLRSSWLYGAATADFYVASKGQPLFPGVTVLVLALLGTWNLVKHRPRRPGRRVLLLALWLIALAGFVLSFGPYLLAGRELTPLTLIRLPYYWLSQVLTPLKSLNAPARLGVLVMLALALLAAYGVAGLAARVRRWAMPLSMALGALILLEYLSIPLPLASVDAAAGISPAYTFLGAQPPGQPVVELPMGQPNFADQDRHVEYTYNSVYHWQPLVNGYSTFIPPEYYALVKDVTGFPSAASVQRLKDWGAAFVVVHSDQYKNASRLRAALDGLAGLEHIQDFQEIWLYRIR